MYVNQDIPSRILKSYIIPDDIEILCVEINLRKQVGRVWYLSTLWHERELFYRPYQSLD